MALVILISPRSPLPIPSQNRSLVTGYWVSAAKSSVEGVTIPKYCTCILPPVIFCAIKPMVSIALSLADMSIV